MHKSIISQQKNASNNQGLDVSHKVISIDVNTFTISNISKIEKFITLPSPYYHSKSVIGQQQNISSDQDVDHLDEVILSMKIPPLL